MALPRHDSCVLAILGFRSSNTSNVSSRPTRLRSDGGRALSDRRQQPGVPGVLRAARVDRHVHRSAHQRDLRVRLDAGQDPHRLRAQGDRRRLGRRLLGAQGGLLRVQGAALDAARSAQGAVAAPGAARGCVRLPQSASRRLRGRRRDRLDRRAGQDLGPAGAGDGRDRRSRRLPARRRRRPDHDDLAGDHRHPRLRPRGGDRALRHPSRAGSRLHRSQGRHQRQHSGRPGDRGQDRGRAAAALRVARAGARQRRPDQRRQTQAEPDRARRCGPRVQAARHRQARCGGRVRRAGFRLRTP